MVNDMEMYLEKVLKKTNPEKYIEILEQDREDFAKEIVELNQRIDKAIEYVKNNKLCICKEDEGMIFTAFVDKELLEILKGSGKSE